MPEPKHQHIERPDLRHVRIVAGMSPMSLQATLDGKPWAGLVSLRFNAGEGQLCRVTAEFYANIEVDAELQTVALSNEPHSAEPHHV